MTTQQSVIVSKPISNEECIKLFMNLNMVKSAQNALETYFKKDENINVSIIGNK